MADDIVTRLQTLLPCWCDDSPTRWEIQAERYEAAAEIERLRRWKEEALVVLSEWEDVWHGAHKPLQRLGKSIAGATAEEIQRLEAENAEMLDLLTRAEHDWRVDGNGGLLVSPMKAIGRFLEARRG